MGFTLTPIVIAAIATASVAGLLVLVISSRWLYRKVGPRSPCSSATPARTSHPPYQNQKTFASWGLGNPISATSEGHRHLMATPSPGSGSGSGSGMPLSTPTPTTASPASSKLKKADPYRKSYRPGPPGRQRDSSPAAAHERPESEMIMVTYEQGLAALGLGRPHHMLYPDDPPQFNETVQAYPTAPSSISTARTVPGRSGLRNDARAREREENTRQWARSPVTRHTPRASKQVTRQPVQSSLLPSYYNAPDHRAQDDGDEDDPGDANEPTGSGSGSGSGSGGLWDSERSRVERWVDRL